MVLSCSDDECVAQALVCAVANGRPGPLSKPIDGYLAGLNDIRRCDLARTLEWSAIGDKEAIGELLTDFIKQTGADEVMIDGRIYDPVARCRSYQYAAEAIS